MIRQLPPRHAVSAQRLMAERYHARSQPVHVRRPYPSPCGRCVTRSPRRLGRAVLQARLHRCL